MSSISAQAASCSLGIRHRRYLYPLHLSSDAERRLNHPKSHNFPKVVFITSIDKIIK